MSRVMTQAHQLLNLAHTQAQQILDIAFQQAQQMLNLAQRNQSTPPSLMSLCKAHQRPACSLSPCAELLYHQSKVTCLNIHTELLHKSRRPRKKENLVKTQPNTHFLPSTPENEAGAPQYRSDPLHQAPLSPTSSSTTPMANAQEKLVSGSMSNLRTCTSSAASTQERLVSDTLSALWPCSPMPSSTSGSVVPEQSRTAPPTPACTQIPNLEAAAFASVCRPLTTGNPKSIIGNRTDPLLHMSTWDPDLQAAYYDRGSTGQLALDYNLSRHTARERSASFHASRSPAAIAIRNQAQSPPPRDRQRTCPVEKHRHWSVSCTDLHPPDYDVPYRLL